MVSGRSHFFYEDDFDAIMAGTDADILQSEEELNLEINSCLRNMPSKKKSSFKCHFCDKFCSSIGCLKRHVMKK